MGQINQKRLQNERKFSDWIDRQGGGRKYWFDVKGRFGWKAKYVKEVNINDETIRFYQEIFDEKGNLVEIHDKFPVDKGHNKVKE